MDRHNTAQMDHNIAGLPAAHDASVTDLAAGIRRLTELARDLDSPLVTEGIRVAQYRRTAEIASWIAAAAGDLDETLTTKMSRDEGEAL